MIVAEDGGYESASDGEAGKVNEIAILEDAQGEEAQDPLFCDFDTSPALIVTKKILMVQK